MPLCSLLDVDPELGAGLAPGAWPRARLATRTEVVTLACGRWRASGPGARTFLVGQGLLVRELFLGARVAAELVGPGDVIDTTPSADGLLPAHVAWHVVADTRLAVLGPELMASVPAVVAHNLMRHAAQRSSRLGTAQAIAQLPRVTDRVLALFGHLAERWGRVTPHGLLVTLALTHETIGRLVGAARPTVSLALKTLAARGDVRRCGNGWEISLAAVEGLRALAPERTAPAAPQRARQVAPVRVLAPRRAPGYSAAAVRDGPS
jgi:CRP/FNR family cyclic AMP-dependent transcriptional regulator